MSLKLHPPVGDMVNQVLFEHEAPPLDDVQQSLFEWFAINSEPLVKHLEWIDLFTLLVYLFVRVNLKHVPIHIVYVLFLKTTYPIHVTSNWSNSI